MLTARSGDPRDARRQILVKSLPASAALPRFFVRERLLRFGDLLIAGVVLVFTMPLMAAVALALRLEASGPIICREERSGLGGRRVLTLKFRTRVDQRTRARGPGYSRLTGIGWFLWYTRIDELPQMINVLRGELSVLGASRG
jgi:lipopolysaccharide/colanic/teichoic acid biosynthesis glycosyltransferase